MKVSQIVLFVLVILCFPLTAIICGIAVLIKYPSVCKNINETKPATAEKEV